MESKCPGCGWEQLEFFYQTRETHILVEKENLIKLCNIPSDIFKKEMRKKYGIDSD